jgi:hypothetical protein
MQEQNDNYVLPERIALADAKRFVLAWHYSKIFPPHCLVNLALRDDSGALCAVAMWGWGVRPKHTIQRLFPGLDTPDYLELNRLCLREDQPRNSESRFLSLCAEWVRTNRPEVKLLFSWADGLRGKPGYVYQAASWLYGGFIKTDLYVDEHGGPIHPRLMITRLGSRGRATWTAHGLSKWLCGIPHNHFYADFWIMRTRRSLSLFFKVVMRKSVSIKKVRLGRWSPLSFGKGDAPCWSIFSWTVGMLIAFVRGLSAEILRRSPSTFTLNATADSMGSDVLRPLPTFWRG